MRIACCVFVAMLCSLAGAASASADQVLVLGKDGRVYSREDPALGPVTMKAPSQARRGRRDGRPEEEAPHRLPRAQATARPRRHHARGLHRAPRRVRGCQAPRQAPGRHRQERDARRAGHGRRDRRASQAQRVAPDAAVADDRAQPGVVDRGPPARQRAAGRVRRLRARLAVLPGPRAAAPDARQLRQAQRALAQPREHAARVHSTSCCRSPSAPAAWRGSTTLRRRPAAVGERPGRGYGHPVAVARAAKRLHREADVLPVAKEALGVFRKRTPTGVRVPAESGDHYAIYPFAPNLRVLNGFIQSLIGLYDYADLEGPRGNRALPGRRARGTPRGPAVRHRCVVAVLARKLDVHESLRPTTTSRRTSSPTCASARTWRSTARPPRTSTRTRPCRRSSRSSPPACAAAATAASRSSCRRSRP